MSELAEQALGPESLSQLELLATEIRGLDEKARATAKTAMELAMETGRKLIQARKIIDQDDAVSNKDKVFGEWRMDNFAMPARTTREYMNLAKAFDGRDVGEIPQSVLYELAAPKNETIREAAFDDLVERKDLNIKDAKEVISEHRQEAGLEQPRPELTPEEQAQKRLSAMVDLFGLEQLRIWLDAFE